jgi:hypothetical protein
LRFVVSIKGLENAMRTGRKSLHPGSIPGEASNNIGQLYLRSAQNSHGQ